MSNAQKERSLSFQKLATDGCVMLVATGKKQAATLLSRRVQQVPLRTVSVVDPEKRILTDTSDWTEPRDNNSLRVAQKKVDRGRRVWEAGKTGFAPGMIYILFGTDVTAQVSPTDAPHRARSLFKPPESGTSTVSQNYHDTTVEMFSGPFSVLWCYSLLCQLGTGTDVGKFLPMHQLGLKVSAKVQFPGLETEWIRRHVNPDINVRLPLIEKANADGLPVVLHAVNGKPVEGKYVALQGSQAVDLFKNKVVSTLVLDMLLQSIFSHVYQARRIATMRSEMVVPALLA